MHVHLVITVGLLETDQCDIYNLALTCTIHNHKYVAVSCWIIALNGTGLHVVAITA